MPGKAGDGSNSDPVPALESAPSCCFTGVGAEAAVAVSDGRYGTGVQVPTATGKGYSKHLSKCNGGGTSRKALTSSSSLHLINVQIRLCITSEAKGDADVRDTIAPSLVSVLVCRRDQRVTYKFVPPQANK
jgi:hypothetical protein